MGSCPPPACMALGLCATICRHRFVCSTNCKTDHKRALNRHQKNGELWPNRFGKNCLCLIVPPPSIRQWPTIICAAIILPKGNVHLEFLLLIGRHWPPINAKDVAFEQFLVEKGIQLQGCGFSCCKFGGIFYGSSSFAKGQPREIYFLQKG